ncbi:MAG: hypothetical protein Q9217_006581 [Psora testacea]
MDEKSEAKQVKPVDRLTLPQQNGSCTTPNDIASTSANIEHHENQGSNNLPSGVQPSDDSVVHAADTKSRMVSVKAKSAHRQKSKPTTGPKRKKQPPMTKCVNDSSSSHASSYSTSSDADVEKDKSKKSSRYQDTSEAKNKPAELETSDSGSDKEPSIDIVKKQTKQKAKKANKPKAQAKEEAKWRRVERSGSSDSDDESSGIDAKRVKLKKLINKAIQAEASTDDVFATRAIAQLTALRLRGLALEQRTTDIDEEAEDDVKSNKKKAKKGSKLEFVRVDRLWSNKEHRFVFSPSTVDKKAGQYEEYAFNIVRYFDYQNKYTSTELLILSQPLKIAMVHVMGKVKGISLEEDKPTIDPNMVFLHLEELRAYMRQLQSYSKSQKSKRKAKDLTVAASHMRLLVDYLDKDYDDIKKSLYPLLESGKITFELAWALFKSNEIVYTNTYATEEQPRAVRIEYVTKKKSVIQGEYYHIEGRFLDSDGKGFGMAEIYVDVMNFKGPRKISRLACYPLKYHGNHEKLRNELIERGKKFVALEGMQYRFQKGIAFHKKGQHIIKVHINGRVMLDPATFRRLRPNYAFSQPKKDYDIVSDHEESDKDTEDVNETSTSSSDDASQEDPLKAEKAEKVKKKQKKAIRKQKKKAIYDSDDPNNVRFVTVSDEDEHNAQTALETRLPEDEEQTKPKFTDEEYLIASPVVLGFSFSEKLWLEFAVSGINDIQWNEGAFDSLMIPEDQKAVVRALVESHAYEAKKNIDDVIQGKGRGLVAVLHGPPGTGKTLTAEGIAELLKKPLYAVSVGELGIKGGDVERSLTQILDVAHTWGALLLLDEADVFLEQRTNYDVGRNALVSIFLRMLEYFQGILFLTTNRVTVFDPAFASRIHIGLRYGELPVKAKKAVWKLFINKLRELPDVEVEDISEDQYTRLANFELNGREIKNAVRTAQSVALIEKQTLGMKHLLQVLLVGSVFAKDLKGAGYEEALKFYM